MHSAFLINEILRLIFEVILDGGKSSLCCVARCCKAWKDPALDCIWRRLPSAVPLLSLLPAFSIENDNIRFDSTTQDAALTTFRSYAFRVKYIVHRHRVLADLESIPMHQMSNLESARIESNATGEVALRMILAPRLRTLTLRVGYTKSSSTSTTVHAMMSLLNGCPSLEHLSVRGHSSECLHVPLGGITGLCSLSLHLSSLTDQSFMTVSSLPRLMDFDVHANSLSYDSLSAAIVCARNIVFFPSLARLKIRAQPALIALVLQQLPRDTLCSLYVDVTGPGPSAFQGLFTAMSALPLHEFTLEHTIAIGASEDIPTYTLDNSFTLEHLRPLSSLPFKCFILDSCLPPDFSDSAIEEVTTWWPRLERLQLGSHAALENAESSWKPRTSLASLSALARGCRCLERLVITLDVESRLLLNPGTDAFESHPLIALSISSRSRPDVSSISATLFGLFPSLVDVAPGFVGEHEDTWAAVQVTLSDLVHGNSFRDVEASVDGLGSLDLDMHHRHRPG